MLEALMQYLIDDTDGIGTNQGIERAMGTYSATVFYTEQSCSKPWGKLYGKPYGKPYSNP